jgi:hypothetical protein
MLTGPLIGWTGNECQFDYPLAGNALYESLSETEGNPVTMPVFRCARQFGRRSFVKNAANRGSPCKPFSRGSTFVSIRLGSR